MFNDLTAAHGKSEEQSGDRAVTSETNRLKMSLQLSHADLPGFFSQPAQSPIAFLLFNLPERGVMSVAVHDLSGRRVRLLVATVMERGDHLVEWDGKDDRGRLLSGGFYEVKLEAANEEGKRYCASARLEISAIGT